MVSSVILAPLAFVAHLGLVAISSFVALARRHCRYRKTEENRMTWTGVVRDREKRARLLETLEMRRRVVGGGDGLSEEKLKVQFAPLKGECIYTEFLEWILEDIAPRKLPPLLQSICH